MRLRGIMSFSADKKRSAIRRQVSEDILQDEHNRRHTHIPCGLSKIYNSSGRADLPDPGGRRNTVHFRHTDIRQGCIDRTSVNIVQRRAYV